MKHQITWLQRYAQLGPCRSLQIQRHLSLRMLKIHPRATSAPATPPPIVPPGQPDPAVCRREVMVDCCLVLDCARVRPLKSLQCQSGPTDRRCDVHPRTSERQTMPATLQDLGIDQLSVDERIELVQAIWDSITPEPHPPLINEAQRRELDARLAAHAADPTDVVPLDEGK